MDTFEYLTAAQHLICATDQWPRWNVSRVSLDGVSKAAERVLALATFVFRRIVVRLHRQHLAQVSLRDEEGVAHDRAAM